MDKTPSETKTDGETQSLSSPNTHAQQKSDSAINTGDVPSEDEVVEKEEATKDVKLEAQAAIKRLAAEKADSASVDGSDQGIIGNTTYDLEREAIKAMAMKAEQERLDRERAEETAKHGMFTDNMALRLDAVDTSDGGKAIVLEVTGDLTVGRADNVTDYTPEIDLTPHGAYRLGLSRRHALIRRNDTGLLVKDLSSRNGTFVNGEQVQAGETHPIRDGDELRFGNLAMRVSFQQST